jgi:hypothetical protein
MYFSTLFILLEMSGIFSSWECCVRLWEDDFALAVALGSSWRGETSSASDMSKLDVLLIITLEVGTN